MTQDKAINLPPTGYVRMAHIAGPIVPVCPATIWRWARSGKFPQPIKLSERVTAWRVEDVRAWMAKQASEVPA